VQKSYTTVNINGSVVVAQIQQGIINRLDDDKD
jgi:hypothetical protein